MQVNRLNHLVFPPATPQVSADGADALAPETKGADTATTPVARAARPAPAAQDVPVLTASVNLDLSSSAKKAQVTPLYSRDGLLAAKSRNASQPASAETTPAEQFVASAVNILRDFEQGKASFPSAQGSAPAQGGLLGGIKNAASRFSLFA